MSRGRPTKNTKIIEVHAIRIEHIITKDDKYNNTMSYLKIVDSGFKQKIKPILSQLCDDLKLPLWKTDDGLYMLKVKKKFIPQKDFEQN